ncbi:MAG: ribonuclease T2 [Pseudolabrys sp.]|nr:ribonuclease T2 [Pseudolabrys sp.]MDP2297241.1 ribonuclease T2 [Pseudolabrys sp.]
MNVKYAGVFGRLDFSHLDRAARTAAVTLSFLFVFAVVAFAQGAAGGGLDEGRKHEPGRFDFYVLALSWSPSYCAASVERAPHRTPEHQCSGRPFSFVVHGLWPQYEHGFPQACQVPAPRLNRGIVDAHLDLMPSPRLIFHQWDKHGTCSGLSAPAYFDNVRKARAAVTVPPDYHDLDKPMLVSPGDVSAAFLKANPGLSRSGLVVACDAKWLTEVRICLTKDLGFRDCPELARRSCRRDRVRMPAVRGG